ncbi:MAG: C1 family peptidase [bacterium]
MRESLVAIVVSFSLMAFAGCGVGEDLPCETGNAAYSPFEALDPLSDFRIDDNESRLLPSSVDHSCLVPQARSQGLTGSCTSWMTAYYLKTCQEAFEEGWNTDAFAFSPMYLFAMQCRTFSQPYSFIAAYTIMKRFGCALWHTLPYEDYRLWDDPTEEKESYAGIHIPETAHVQAREFRCGEMIQLCNLTQVREALTEGPVMVAINHWGDPPSSVSPETNSLEYMACRTKSHHILVCVGYDDSRFGEGALKVVNSKGDSWGEQGYSWIRYSDYSGIVDCAMAIQDLPNVNRAGLNIREVPAAPSQVIASDDAGPYVDVTWERIPEARYYRIFRTRIGDPDTHTFIGSSHTPHYRDYPEPGIPFYYAVSAANEIGESTHHSLDTDEQGYVDRGSALGRSMSPPSIFWVFNDAQGASFFAVSNIDETATSLHVAVSATSDGHWDSLGWIAPGDFTISWGKDSAYTGRMPQVKVRACSAHGTSSFSEPARVNATIAPRFRVASIRAFSGRHARSSIELSWEIDEGNVDFYELWRCRAASDETHDWVLAGYVNPPCRHFTDSQVIPGIAYFYAVISVYRGTHSPPAIMEQPVRIPTANPNLYLYDFTYQYGEITTHSVGFEIHVWNEGDVPIHDYPIALLIYGGQEDEAGETVSLMQASDIAGQGQLPLLPGEYHTLAVSLDIPESCADGRPRSWGFRLDPCDSIDEQYESDNLLEGHRTWWMSDRQAMHRDTAEDLDETPTLRTSARSLNGITGEDTTPGTDVGPIPYTRPSF